MMDSTYAKLRTGGYAACRCCNGAKARKAASRRARLKLKREFANALKRETQG